MPWPPPAVERGRLHCAVEFPAHEDLPRSELQLARRHGMNLPAVRDSLTDDDYAQAFDDYRDELAQLERIDANLAALQQLEPADGAASSAATIRRADTGDPPHPPPRRLTVRLVAAPRAPGALARSARA